jgi:hypothetical protein
MPVYERADHRRRDGADENLSRTDERKHAPRNPQVARERFKKNA